ncbi:MAG: SPOR domain-containing protein [Thermoanaerobaculia bacterium]
MSGEDLTASRVRRMLPSVSEVLRELTTRASIEPDVAFRAARDVCAEELKRIRDAGGESVPIEALVERALARVAGVPPPLVVAAPPPHFTHFERSEPEPLPAVDAAVAEDPFSETTGALDLRWDREAREPLGASAAVVPVEEEPPLPSPVEGVPGHSAFEEAAAPSADALPSTAGQETHPAEEGGGYVFALPEEDAAPEPQAPTAETPEEFGDETLTRLSREAEAMDLRSVFAGERESSAPSMPEGEPQVTPEDSPAAGSVERDGASAPPAPFEDDEDTVLTIPRGGRRRAKGEDGPRWGRLAGIAAALAVLAALGYLLVGLWIDRGPETGRVAAARRAPAEAGTPVGAPAGTTPASAPDAGAQPEAAATGSSAMPAPPAGDAAPAATPAASAGPASSAARPTAVPTVAPAAPSVVPVATVPPAPVRQSRDGLVVTRDRAGRPEIFSIHFTSYRDRAAAERDLKRIAALVEREGFVAEVDLGEKGVWYRVMVGEFPSAEEAKAIRAELAAKGTRDMGWVYRVVGP